MIRILTAALLVAYLPGATLFRVPLGHSPLRARLAADERVFWEFIEVPAGSLIEGWESWSLLPVRFQEF